MGSTGAEARIDARAVLAAAVGAVGLVLAVSRPLFAAYVAVTVVDGLCPAAIAWIAKRIVERVLAGDAQGAVALGLTELGLVALQSSALRVREVLDVALRGRLTLEVQLRILEKVRGLKLWHFEDSAFLDRLERARSEAGQRPMHLVTHAFVAARGALRVASCTALLWQLSPLVAAFVAFAVVPQFLAQARMARASFAVQRARTHAARRAWYLQTLMAVAEYVQEIKLFALGGMVVSRYRALVQGFTDEDVRVARRGGALVWAAGLVTSGALYGAYVYVVARAAQGAFGLPEMTMDLVLLRQTQGAFEEALVGVARVLESSLYMTNLFELLAMPDDEPDERLPEQHWVAQASPPAIRFEGVSFRYPGSERLAIDDVTLEIRPGETLALVGANGAGKTTLVRLLLRMQELGAGRILLDGADITAVRPAALRGRIGVLFQDFTQFTLSFAENVGVGWLPSLDDRAAIGRAVEQSGADEVARRLSRGMDTILGRYFGGDELSKGQWQRVALARAFMRQGDVLVLDEPTASIDAETEHDVFRRLAELDHGKTCLLITHRLAAVRLADRIAVMHDGRLVEHGTHEELVARGGRYARMFELHAGALRPAADGRAGILAGPGGA